MGLYPLNIYHRVPEYLTNRSGTRVTNYPDTTALATVLGEITQNKGHCAVQGHSKSPIWVPIESSFLLVINTNFIYLISCTVSEI